MEYIFEAKIEEKFETNCFEFVSLAKFKYFRILNYIFIDLYLAI